jgi:hypothetical protein
VYPGLQFCILQNIGALLFQLGVTNVAAPVMLPQFAQAFVVVDVDRCEPAGVPPVHTEQLALLVGLALNEPAVHSEHVVLFARNLPALQVVTLHVPVCVVQFVPLAAVHVRVPDTVLEPAISDVTQLRVQTFTFVLAPAGAVKFAGLVGQLERQFAVVLPSFASNVFAAHWVHEPLANRCPARHDVAVQVPDVAVQFVPLTAVQASVPDTAWVVVALISDVTHARVQLFNPPEPLLVKPVGHARHVVPSRYWFAEHVQSVFVAFGANPVLHSNVSLLPGTGYIPTVVLSPSIAMARYINGCTNTPLPWASHLDTAKINTCS